MHGSCINYPSKLKLCKKNYGTGKGTKLNKIPRTNISPLHHGHKKRKDSLEGSLDQVLFAAELGVPEDTSTKATSAYINYKHCMCRKVRMIRTTVFFKCDNLFGALIHLNFIILILICF